MGMGRFVLAFCLILAALGADDESNILLSQDTVQVSSSIGAYDSLKPNLPIQGSVMVTHDKNTTIDAESFKLGQNPLKVHFIQTIQIPDSTIQIAIYQFQLEGRKVGQYTLPSIFVKVGGKEYQAPPLTFQIGNE